MSRVECMLKLPSLDLVFSSNRGELELPGSTHPAEPQHTPSSTPPSVHSNLRVPGSKGRSIQPLCDSEGHFYSCFHCKHKQWCLLSGPFLGLGSPLGRSRHSSSQSDLSGPTTNSSGLSFTACMSDFSLYVFHPYGAGKQKSAVTGLPPGPGPLGKWQILKQCYTLMEHFIRSTIIILDRASLCIQNSLNCLCQLWHKMLEWL